MDGETSVERLLTAMEKLVDRGKENECRQEALGTEKPPKKEEKKRNEKKDDWKKKEKGSSVNALSTTTAAPPTTGQQPQSEQQKRKDCPECRCQHNLVNCSKFKSFTPDERLRHAKDVYIYICFRCLKKHGKEQCEFPAKWEGEGNKCRYAHNKLLQGAVARRTEKKTDNVSTTAVTAASDDVTVMTGEAGEQ
jgi:hypothetical protein